MKKFYNKTFYYWEDNTKCIITEKILSSVFYGKIICNLFSLHIITYAILLKRCWILFYILDR